MMDTSSTDCGSVWITSELYYPEVTSTGHVLTRIAEGLAAEFRVRVICGQPSYSLRGTKAPARQQHNGVEIHRCWATTWDKDVLAKRLVNLVTISCSIFLRLLVSLRRGDTVMVVTNPPSLPFVAALACRLRGAKCLLLIHDVYPDFAVTAGVLRADSTITRILNWFTRRLHRSMERIVVLGRDMRDLVIQKSGLDPQRVTIITNWADHEEVYPMPRSENRTLQEARLAEKFVIQHAGNMGLVHDVGTIVECAKRLREHDDVHFLMIGSGAKRAWMQQAVHESKLRNVTLLPPRPRSQSRDFLNACDVAISAFVPGMFGVSVPSRAYNILAAGKPIIALTDRQSELAQMIEEEQVGWVVPCGDAQGMADAILEAKSSPDRLAEMCRRARMAAETKYTLSQVIGEFTRVLRQCQ